MGGVLQAHRVAFAARAEDDDDLSRLSSAIDLSPYQLRAILFPSGGTGALTALVRTADRDKATNVEVGYVEAVGFSLDLAIGTDEDAGSWIVIEQDWPLMETVFVLGTPRDEAVDVILITEIRG